MAPTAAWDGEGRRHYLCKRYPTVLDLALRGFAPDGLRRRLQTRLNRYELHEQAGDADAEISRIIHANMAGMTNATPLASH